MPIVWLLLMACGSNDPGTKPDPTGTEPTTPSTTPPTQTTPTTPVPTDIPDGLSISEVQTRNISTHVNPADNTFCDWIEIHNNSGAPVDLARFSISDGSNNDPWRGAGTLEEGAYLVLYGSGEKPGDQLNPGPYEHELPFNLDSDGEELHLFWDDYEFASEEIPKLSKDLSFARIPDGSPEMAITAAPTPGAANPQTPTETLVPADETWFLSEVMHEIAFTLTPQAYNTMNGYAENEVPAEVLIDNEAYLTRVGLRLKGSASFDTMDGKPAFKVDINQYIPGGRFRGLKAFNLHNGNVYDPTRVRDWISYSFAREVGLMAPRVGWAHVTVNDIDYGVYMIIEQHDDEMIQYNYPGEEDLSYLFEPNETQSGGWGGDFGVGGGTLSFDIEEGPLPMGAAQIEVLNAVDAILSKSNPSDADVEELWLRVDKDNLLSYLAWETITMHTDGYRSPNNWRLLLRGSNNMLEWVPAGAEWTWAQRLDTYPNWGGSAMVFCFRNRKCKMEYSERLLEVADIAEGMDLPTEFEDLSNWIDPYTAADPRSRFNQTTVNNERRTTLSHLQDNPDDARADVYAAFPSLAP